MSATREIPYERQTDPTSNRMCGAAALCMVYRSFGKEHTQAEVWAKISRPTLRGGVSARTHLMAQDALGKGLAAVVFRARDPLAALASCHARGLRVVLNHRLSLELPTGHYAVLVGLADEHVLVHDPQVGPSTRLRKSDLLKLWQPCGPDSEITGRILIAVGDTRAEPYTCGTCGKVVPASIPCPGCRKSIPLQPAVALGCVAASCPARTWEQLFCPFCDAGLKELGGRPGAATPAQPSAEDGLDVAKLSEVLDKFQALLNGILARTPSRDLQQIVDQLRPAMARVWEAQARQQAAVVPVVPRPAPSPAPAPPAAPAVNGNELGWKLVQELGLQDGYGEPGKEVQPAAEPAPMQPEPPRKTFKPMSDDTLVRKAVARLKKGKDKDRGDFDSIKPD